MRYESEIAAAVSTREVDKLLEKRTSDGWRLAGMAQNRVGVVFVFEKE